MPCFMTGSREGDLELSRQESSSRATKLNRLLCGVLTELENVDPDTLDHLLGGDEELAHYWEEHQEIDRERKAKEEFEKNKQHIKARALNKLTPEERKALGV